MQKNNTSKFNLIIVALSTCLFSFGCSKASSDDSNSNPQEVAEADLCSTSTTYTTFATLNGTATFAKRGLQTTLQSGEVESFKLGSIVSGLPIRFAEIRVLNGTGAVVQCGKTNASGALKALDGSSDLRVPATAGTYTVEVLSRTNYNPVVPGGKPAFTVLFSVKESIYSNTVYKAEAFVNVNAAITYNSVNPTAEANTTKIEGGAFNIYNDIITSYEYLANNTGTQNISCLNPKMSVYWKAGFNPAQYIYPDDEPGSLSTISFYIRTDKELYISGGRLGNVSSEDTDHFDDSVIIHELGHHVENVCGAMDSPGGQHSGQAKIDPRLAWSEAWGNFFGAHIIRNNTNSINPNLAAALPSGEWLYYVDTQGYTDGGSTTGYEYLKFNLARVGNVDTYENIYNGPGAASPYAFDPVNSSTNPGEGHFREVAIARGLFKSTNTCSSPFQNCANQNNFSDVWKAFEKYTTGMGQSVYPFRSSIRFLERFRAAKGGSLSGALTTVFETEEAMQLASNATAYVSGGYTTWVPYGIKLVKSGVFSPSATPCNLKITPKSNSSYKSDQRFSNHFYYIDSTTLTGVTSIRTTNTNVDLLLLPEGYRYNEDCNSSSCSKSVTGALAYDRTSSPRSMTLPASTHALLNVRSYVTGSVTPGTEYIYTLTSQTGEYLCPSNSF